MTTLYWQELKRSLLNLSEEGAQYASKGTPEYQYASALEFKKPIDKKEVENIVGEEIAKIGFAKAMSKKWI